MTKARGWAIHTPRTQGWAIQTPRGRTVAVHLKREGAWYVARMEMEKVGWIRDVVAELKLRGYKAVKVYIEEE